MIVIDQQNICRISEVAKADPAGEW